MSEALYHPGLRMRRQDAAKTYAACCRSVTRWIVSTCQRQVYGRKGKYEWNRVQVSLRMTERYYALLCWRDAVAKERNWTPPSS